MQAKYDPARIAELEKAEQKLRALEALGVDSWEGYDDAMQLMEETQ